MPATIQFVDSISATATLRLDLNDSSLWFTQSFKAPPPRLRRSVSQNAMRDGQHVSSSSYEAREVTLDLTLSVASSNEETAATEMQKLWRELDRETNYLKYQGEGMAKPVFFVLQRSDVEDLEELWTSPIARNITIVLPAEPFALGLRETLGPYTVTNDPAAATNGCYFDVTGVLGDVPTPPVYWDSSGISQNRLIGVGHTSTTPPLLWAQAESVTMGNSTSNPGGAADATFSGAGLTNSALTTFAGSATMVTRLEWSAGALTGSYRVLAFARRSGATSTLTVQAVRQITGVGAGVVTVPTVLTRQLLDLGILHFPDRADVRVGSGGVANAPLSSLVQIRAARTGGSDQISWDVILLVPVGGQSDEVAPPSLLETRSIYYATVIDSRTGLASTWSAGDPSAGTSQIGPTPIEMAGGLPTLTVGASVNRHIVIPSATDSSSSVTATNTVRLAYWPQYLLVRPSAT